MALRITKKIVDAASPKEQPYVIWDSELTGFGLKITPKGNKSYLLYYRSRDGKQRKPTIGKHGVFTPDEARSVAKRWLAQVALGHDVSAEKQLDKQAETVSDLADRYMIDYAEVHKKPRSVSTDRANIENHVKPLLGGRKVKDITRADIDQLKLDIRNGKTARKLPAKARGRRNIKGGSGIANRVLALLSKMFSCAMDWGMRDDNPAMGIKKFKEHRKDRFLDANEIARLVAALDDAAAHKRELPSVVAAIRLLLYTGLRLNEVLSLMWQDVDLTTGIVELRDSKTGARRVPLNSLAVEVLKEHHYKGASGLVLEGTVSDRPISLTRPWYRIREAAGIDKSANLHSLRHTFASWSVMTGLSLPQVGALLGHKSAQTTLRYADHVTDALQAYSEQTSDAFRNIVRK